MPEKNLLEVVADTNVLISALIGKLLRQLIEHLRAEKFAELLTLHSHFVISTVTINACRDAKDNIFLECAVDGSAKYIVSGDPDLLILNPYQNIAIITPNKFLKLLS